MARKRAPLTETGTGRVEDLNHEGWGVVKSGKAVFVAGALPGELVEYRIRRRERSHDEAELLQVVEPSPQRVTPGCEHFGICGGCSLQHLAPEAQRAVKDNMLRESLRRIGKVEPDRWLAPLHGDPWAYRRRARLGARFVHAKGRSLVGFREKMSSFVADVKHCRVLVSPIGNLIGELSTLLTALSIPTRVPQIEVAVGDNTTVLVMRTLSPLSTADRQLMLEFAHRHGVHWLLQAGRPDQLEPLEEGTPGLWYELPEHGVRLAFEPTDFIQVNGDVNRRLIAQVLGELKLEASSSVLDLFCGLGNFTLPMARVAGSVVGLEGDAGLIERARANAAANGLANARFGVANLAGDGAMERCLAGAGAGKFTHVLLDPPRTGAADVLPAVARLAPRRVVYVSCHPGSLARDLGILVTDHGFSLRAAGIVDMFPHTSHVESVAVLDGPGVSRE
ncbi:MAG: 23S rRNA (uracil(1939)-C(5))-methyltransferase RlmD [Gammaproteobacteria bacterium]|nr:23S rRNA (uracil(1939)-C(5))-methyltransferase RlmD [Gammaproteobacteria bacterium]